MASAITQRPGRHEFILRLTEELRSMNDPSAIQLHACTALAEHLGADFAHYADYLLDDGLVVVGPAYSRVGRHTVAGKYAVADFGDPAAEGELGRPTLVVVDTTASPTLP